MHVIRLLFHCDVQNVCWAFTFEKRHKPCKSLHVCESLALTRCCLGNSCILFYTFQCDTCGGWRIINTWHCNNIYKYIQHLNCGRLMHKLTNMTNVNVGCVYVWLITFRPIEWEHFVLTLRTAKLGTAKMSSLCTSQNNLTLSQNWLWIKVKVKMKWKILF